MAGRRFSYLAILSCCVVFCLSYHAWLGWVLLMAVLWMPVLSLAVSLPAMLTFRAEPASADALPAGVEGETWLVGQCPLPVPPFRGRLLLTRVTTGEVWRHKGGGELPTEHCGGVRILPEKVRVYDYLGLIGIPVRKKQPKTVLIRPKSLTMQAPPDLERFLARSWRPKPGGGYSENHELRLYRPGDGLNQVHWKLTAKTGKLIIREPMQPDRGLMLLTMNLRGTPEELDRKFGRLLWLGTYLLEQGVGFDCRVLTGGGILSRRITGGSALQDLVDELLCCESAMEGDLRQRDFPASWQYHIGGGEDEA